MIGLEIDAESQLILPETLLTRLMSSQTAWKLLASMSNAGIP